MNPLLPHTLIILLINIVGTYLCFLVYFSGQRRALRYIFTAMMFSMFVWVDFAYAARVFGEDVFWALFSLRIAWFITPVFFTFLYYFTIYLIGENVAYRKLSAAVSFVGVVLAIICGVTGLVIAGFEFDQATTTLGIHYGAGKLPFFFAVFAMVCATLVPLFKKYVRISREEKDKFQFYIIGIIIFYAFNTIFNIILPAFLGVAEFYFLGDYSTIFLLLLTAYAITNRKLMDAKVFAMELVIFLIAAVLAIDFAFVDENLLMRTFKLGALLGFAYLGRELILSMRKQKEDAERINRANAVLAERNKDLNVLLETSAMISQGLDSRKISQGIVDSIPESLKYLGYDLGIIFLYSATRRCIRVFAVTDSPLSRKVEADLGVSIRDNREIVTGGEDLVTKTIRNEKVYKSDRMGDFFSNFLSEENCEAAQKMLKARTFVSVPLFSAGKVMGALVLANGRRKDHMTKRNTDIIRAIAEQIGSSVEKAKLYEKTNRQMTELSALNKNLNKTNVRLQELLEMKNEFLHITSHQLRTPLTSIRGMISMWLDGDFDKMPESERKEMLRRIYVSVERLNKITNDMLDALELEGGVTRFELKKLSLAEIIQDAVSTLQPEFDKKGLYLRFDRTKEELPPVEGEPNYLSQVFMNLIDNACKYTRQGGATISLSKNGRYIDVLIEDTGVGMSAGDLRRVFEKFTRGQNAARENASGSGLGLFIAKKIIEEHEGKVTVTSAGVGKGTKFHVSLPVWKGE